MTPNQQEEMFGLSDKEIVQMFKDHDLKVFGFHAEMNSSDIERFVQFRNGVKSAYTLQQEKIEKLGKVVKDQEKERQGAEAFWKRRLEIHQREIDSLKSDLDKVTMAGIVENWTIGMPNCEQDLREIRQRHKLDKSEEV